MVWLAACVASANVNADPTRPLGYVATKSRTTQKFKLQSVLISDMRKVATINGQQVREHESIKGSNGVTVQKILPHEVVVKQGKKTWRLSLRSQQVNRKIREVN